MDRISIKGLEIFANHGVFKEENVLGQKFVINIDMYTSTRAAGIRDDCAAEQKMLYYSVIWLKRR